MKKIVCILVLLLLCAGADAQKRDDKAISSEILAEFERMKADFTENDNEWVFVKVFDAENQSKDDIFTKALEVLVSLYKDAKEVIQIKDKESGLIVGKGFSDSDIRTINWTTICRNRCWHIIKIEIKDNKFRVTVTVSGVEREQDADLRHPFDGTEYTLRSFYPYWTECKTKFKQVSFDNLRYVYSSSLALIKAVEDGVKKGLNNSSNEW
jgi:hypothetical protein|nr:MAG TPA: hypothetical protein [Caudoviricetes sp.]DAY97372.1 MAG TPA: hypothetical protein [Caudoviricetes sp.]